jgi:hypothetical protein
MIPAFPQFKGLEMSDRSEIDKFTSLFPPYSDFNFVSLWSWDLKGEVRLSILNGNLVVRFTHYITGELFYSFIGINQVDDTAKKIIELSAKEGLAPSLILVPEKTAELLNRSDFKVSEDADHFDYIYDLQFLSEMKGGNYETHRQLINQFLKSGKKWEVRTIDFTEISSKNSILTLFTQWIKNKGDSMLLEEYKNEFLALNKLLSVPKTGKMRLVCFGLYVESKLIGFVMNEIVNKENSIIHFEKADTTHKGCYPFLMQQNSKHLLGLGIKYMNFEQDLGIPSLRFTKAKFRPKEFLKKYLVLA